MKASTTNFTQEQVDQMMKKIDSENKSDFNFFKLLGSIAVAIVLLVLFTIVIVNILFAGILNKGFILSVIALPVLIYVTYRLNKGMK